MRNVQKVVHGWTAGGAFRTFRPAGSRSANGGVLVCKRGSIRCMRVCTVRDTRKRELQLRRFEFGQQNAGSVCELCKTGCTEIRQAVWGLVETSPTDAVDTYCRSSAISRRLRKLHAAQDEVPTYPCRYFLDVSKSSRRADSIGLQDYCIFG